MSKDKTDQFIKKARKVHGDKFDYSLVEYTHSRKPVMISCSNPEHSPFSQTPYYHLRGRGCYKCNTEVTSGKRKAKLIDYAKKIDDLYDNRFDTSKVNALTRDEVVSVGCPIHGYFDIKVGNLLRGNGCKKCATYGDKTAKQWFIGKSLGVHGNKYNYDKVVYLNSHDKVTITCPVHGDWQQTPSSHMTGNGCKSCSMYGNLTQKEYWLSEVIKKHKDTYDYSGVEFITLEDKVDILCHKHGIFSQRASHHLRGNGCPSCHFETKRKGRLDFIEEAVGLYGDKYDYDELKYKNNHTKTTITCKLHGSFRQQPKKHLLGEGCPICSSSKSKAESDIHNWIESLGLKTLSSDRQLIKPLELDIIIPEKKVAIEYNGVYWHSEKFGKDKNYHLNKTSLCKEQGYRLIHIWEDDYNKNPERELSFIRHTLGCSETKTIYARKTTPKEVNKDEAKKFLDAYHIQGSVGASSFIGAYLENKLVSVTAFTYKDNKSYVELVRHVNHGDYNVVGSLGKATKYFSKLCDLDIISFCDLARFDGKSYEKAGFIVDKILPPDYKYVLGDKREHKFNWRKKNIKSKISDIYDDNLTEKEMMELADIPRIWDCGKIRYIYKKRN